MRKLLPLVVLAPLALAACAEGFKLPTPGSFGATSGISAKVDQFCAADFAAQPKAAVAEWVLLANIIATAVGREPFDTDGITKGEAVMKLEAVRTAYCLARPVVIEAVAEAAAADPAVEAVVTE